MQHRITLHRTTAKGNTRYYHLELFLTLFGEFCLERTYGNVRFRSPTGVMKTYYRTMQDAKKFYDSLVKQKIKKGYTL